jgi:hypothetical protein
MKSMKKMFRDKQMSFQFVSCTLPTHTEHFLFDDILNIYLLYCQLESFKRHLMQSLRDDSSSVCLSI